MFTPDTVLEINNTTKKIRIVDNTDLSTLNLAVVTVTGTGTITDASGTVIASGITIDRSAGDTESIWYNLPLTTASEIVNGVYKLTYTLGFAVTAVGVESFTETAGIYHIQVNGVDWVDIFDEEGVTKNVTIASATDPANDGTKTITGANLSGSNTVLVSSTAVVDEASSPATITFNVSYTTFVDDAEFTYNGCDVQTPTISASYDCETGRYGQIIFTDTTVLPTDQTLDGKTWTITYPQNLSDPATPAPVTSTSASVTINQLATGTWTAKLVYNVTVEQADGLIITYTQSSIVEEYKVDCTGSFCELVCCMEKIMQQYNQSRLLGANPPTYAWVVTAMSGFYATAITAKNCGDQDKYVANKALLAATIESCDACDCGCGCSDDTLGNHWIDNQTDLIDGDTTNNVIFAGLTPYSKDGELAPSTAILDQDLLDAIAIPPQFFQFAAELTELGLTVGKKFVDFETNFTADNAVTVTLTLAGTLEVLSAFSMAQNDNAHFKMRIGTKLSGTSTVFTIQTVRTHYLAGGTVGVTNRYYEETDLVNSAEDLTFTFVTGGSFPKELITVMPTLQPFITE